MKQRTTVCMILVALVLLSLNFGLPSAQPAYAGINGDQVRVYLVDGPGVQITYMAVSGYNQHDSYVEWKSYPFAREAKTTNWWWKYSVNTWVILSNGVQMSCFISLYNYPWTNTQSIGIYSSGNGQTGGGPGSRCTRTR